MRAIDRRRGVDCDTDRCGIYNSGHRHGGTAKPDSLPENLVEKAGSVVVGPRRRR